MTTHKQPQWTRILKDLEDSARDFASIGLEASSRALDATAHTLKNLEGELKKTAERLSSKQG
jgi:hypothetical protein